MIEEENDDGVIFSRGEWPPEDPHEDAVEMWERCLKELGMPLRELGVFRRYTKSDPFRSAL